MRLNILTVMVLGALGAHASITNTMALPTQAVQMQIQREVVVPTQEVAGGQGEAKLSVRRVDKGRRERRERKWWERGLFGGRVVKRGRRGTKTMK